MTTALAEAGPIGPAGNPPPAGRRSLDADGFPTSHDERWLYTPISEVIERLPPMSAGAPSGVTRDIIDDRAGRHGAIRLVVVDGHFVDELSDRPTADGLWCGPASQIPTELAPELVAARRQATELESSDGFARRNNAASPDDLVIVASAGAVVAEVVHIVQLHVSDDELSNPRTVIAAGAGSRLHVVETFVGTSPTGFTNAVTFAAVGDGAELTHDRVQREPTTAIHLGVTIFDQAARSHVATTSITIGADISRHAVDVVQRGDHAMSVIDGLYVPRGRQRHDTSITVDHAASHGGSTQRISGVIDDRAHGSFTGHVVVRPGTKANDARQSNRNLLMTSTAQANTRPWLEIFADDVQCTHGATIGRLDAEALFYLRSRGIAETAARSMLVDAFIAEIVDTISPTSLADEVRTSIADFREIGHP